MTKKATGKPFEPGQSGNPSGRPKGSGTTAKLRADIAKHAPDVITKLVEMARAGDTQAARLLLERVLPPVKATDSPAPITLPEGSLSDQARAVMAAAGRGEIAPAQAAQLLTGLGAVAKIVEVDEIEKRLSALESRPPN